MTATCKPIERLTGRHVAHLDEYKQYEQCLTCDYIPKRNFQGLEAFDNPVMETFCECADWYWQCLRCVEACIPVACPCPNCGKEPSRDNAPFCSARCWAEVEDEGLLYE